MYESGPASLFVSRARAAVSCFTYHYDRQNKQWNVFERVNGREEYVCSFLELWDAKEFCDAQNEGE